MCLFACICENVCVWDTWRMVSTGLGVIGRYPIGPTWEVPLYQSGKKKGYVLVCLFVWLTTVLKWIKSDFQYHVRINPWPRQTPRWRVLERRNSQTILQSFLLLVLQICLQEPSLRFSPMDLSWGWFCSLHLQNSVEIKGLKGKFGIFTFRLVNDSFLPKI